MHCGRTRPVVVEFDNITFIYRCSRTSEMERKQLEEVCIDSLDSAIAAVEVEGGTDQLGITVCSALSEGDLTPIPGLLLSVKLHISDPVEVYVC